MCPGAEEQKRLTLDSPPPNLSTNTHLHIQSPVQARAKMPPGAGDGSNMSSGIDFGANCNLKKLKMSTQLFPEKGPYT